MSLSVLKRTLLPVSRPPPSFDLAVYLEVACLERGCNIEKTNKNEENKKEISINFQ